MKNSFEMSADLSSDEMESEFNTKCIIKLTVNNILGSNQVIQSENFTIGVNNEWYIKLNPNFGENDTNYLSVYLYLAKSNESKIKAKYRVSIIDANNEEQHASKPGTNDYTPYGKAWGYSKFIGVNDLLSQANDLLPNNKFTICLCIEVFDHKKLCSFKKFNFRKLINNKDLSDFKFIVRGKEFFVSKAILSLHSTVFEAMFMSDMKEKNENEVIIEDIDSEVFEEFLNFIYLGKLDKIETMVKELLYVSDKYNVLDLKTICEDFIGFDMTIENSIQTLIIADKFNSEKVKLKAIDCIASNMNDIRSKSMNEWLDFIKFHNQLIDQIIQVMVKQMPLKSKVSEKVCTLKSYTF